MFLHVLPKYVSLLLKVILLEVFISCMNKYQSLIYWVIMKVQCTVSWKLVI